MKKILAMVLALVMVLGLASCGLVGKEAPVEEKPAASTTTPAAPSTSGDAAAAERPVYTNSTETQGKSNEIVIKFSHGAAETAPPVKAALSMFAPEVEFNSNGRIGVEVYSNAQIGDDTTATEMLIAGQLEMVNPSTAMFPSWAFSTSPSCSTTRPRLTLSAAARSASIWMPSWRPRA